MSQDTNTTDDSMAPKPGSNTSKDEEAINRELLLNHEYDGIREYDNPMPKWWKYIFWASFYFAIGYILHYHITGNGSSIAESYAADLSEAREKEAMAVMGGGVTEEAMKELMGKDAMMGDAAKLFVQRCTPCHGPKGEGMIGPNLTDETWIHLDSWSLMNVYDIISEGIQSKGMPPWKRQLRPIEMAKLAAYVGTIKDTNVPGKAPEGKKLSSADAAGAAGEQAAGAESAPASGSSAASASAPSTASAAAGSATGATNPTATGSVGPSTP